MGKLGLPRHLLLTWELPTSRLQEALVSGGEQDVDRSCAPTLLQR